MAFMVMLSTPKVIKITHLENPNTTRGPKRHPRDPKLVPWDQNFCLKNFLVLPSNEVILCILLIYVGEIGEKQEKLVILACFAYYYEIWPKLTGFS